MFQLNVLVDGAAKAYMSAIHDQQQQSIAVEPWSLRISGKKIVRDLKSSIDQHEKIVDIRQERVHRGYYRHDWLK